MTERSLASGSSLRQGQALADRYVLGEALGRGGMADVYQATDRLLERQVAVKVLRPPGLDRDERRRFLSEARMLAGLSHPGLVTLLDVYSGDDCTFLVMELVEGTSLSQLPRAQRLSPRRVIDIGKQLAQALSYVHAQGVVHRDIKPANVIIGSDERVRLADFGIARVLGDLTRHTATGFTMGTAAYVAPEQLRGDVSPSVDIYALGLVLLECLTGTPAFKGTATEVCLARVTASPAIPASLPGAWQSLLSEMTALDPQHRPSASSVATRLAAMGAAADAHVTTDTQALSLHQTRALTTPMPVEERLVAAAAAVGIPDRKDADRSSRDRQKVISSRIRPLTQVSTGAQLVFLALLVLIVVACVGLVINSAGEGTPVRDQAPDVPGKIGRDLQSLHDAVYP